MLSVVFFHAFPENIPGGFVGVDIFFVISGFLITGQILQHSQENSFNFIDFYARRIRRIFPALLTVTTSSLIFGWFALLPDEYEQLGNHVAASTIFVINFLLESETGYFNNDGLTKPMLHLWSLAVEEQFYIIWPLLIWLFIKLNRSLYFLMLSAVLASFIASLYLSRTAPESNFFWPFGRLWELAWGGTVALISHNSANQIRVPTIFRKYIKVFTFPYSMIFKKWLSACGFFLILLSFLISTEDMKFPSIWTAIPVLGTSLVILGEGTTQFKLFLTSRPVKWLGVISYPLYLWHWPILSFLYIAHGETLTNSLIFFGIVISVLISALTFIVVEQPIRKQERNYPTASNLVFLLAAVGISGLMVSDNNGMKNRAAASLHAQNLAQLNRTSAIEEECKNFLQITELLFNYCKIKKIDSDQVVAIIGDSHAHAAFPGIANGLADLGYSTVLLANSSCPPFIGQPGGLDLTEKRSCEKRTRQIISSAESIENLKSVFFFSRGPTYWLGNEYHGRPEGPSWLTVSEYFTGLQQTLYRFNDIQIPVFYVTENPELKTNARSCLPRPLTGATRLCEQNMNIVLERQKVYRENLQKLNFVKILDSNEAFCDKKTATCFAVSPQSQLLYSDDDHVSIHGSARQFEKIIAPIFK